MAADGLSAITVKLLHGRNSHCVKLVLPEEEHGDVLTVGHLAKAVEEISGVPIPRQQLVHKGVLLSEMRRSLKKCGIQQNAKIMLNGNEPLPDEEPDWIAFKEMKRIFEYLDSEMTRVIHELDGVHRGYLSSGGASTATANALRKLGSHVQSLKSRFEHLSMQMQQLTFPECNKRGPAERNGLLQKLDLKIGQCDSLIRGITEMLVKGEFLSGKLCSVPSATLHRGI